MQLPNDLQSKIYKLVVNDTDGSSYGLLSYPTYSFKRYLDVLDNGYWDVSLNTNLYKLFEGTTKESICRAELEIAYTNVDVSILNIRKSRISNVWGKIFGQEVANADEDYRRKIWNLFVGFRNTSTFKGAYYTVKAFTNIVPKINRLYDDGWILGVEGSSELGQTTTLLSSLSAAYGVSVKVHLTKDVSGAVFADTSNISFDSSSVGLSTVTDAYKGNYLVFKTGNNRYRSKIINNYLYSGGISTIKTDPFLYDTTAGDIFFITKASLADIESYTKKNINLHTSTLFNYYSDYVTENYVTNFTGTMHNLEKIPSNRMHVSTIDSSYNDNGVLVQGMYDSGVGIIAQTALYAPTAQGSLVWDSIEWGGSNIDFRLYTTFAPDTSNTWTYSTNNSTRVKFNGITDVFLAEYIKENSEVVGDSSSIIYTKNIDYGIDYRKGNIHRVFSGSIPENTLIPIKYDLDWGLMTQNQTIDLSTSSRRYMKYRFTINGVQDIQEWEFSGVYLKQFS